MMSDSHILVGEQIYKLIPQRPPIVMVDTLYEATETTAHTGLTVEAHNYFYENNHLQESGLIEHIAQSAAAFAGYAPYMAGEAPKLGFIAEVKKCKIHTLPQVHDVLHTHLEVMSELGAMRLIKASTHVGEQQVAECQMKIFMKED